MSITLKINTRQSDTGDKIRTVRFFNDFEMNLKYDSIADTFSFTFLFNPNNPEHAEIACVSHYHECAIYYDNELLINGYMLSQGFRDTAKPELVHIGGYSKAGVFEDCDVPTSLYPLESNGLSLRAICQRILNNFNTHIRSKEGKFKLFVAPISRTAASSRIVEKMDATIPKSTAKESENIKSYLTGLATKKNLVLSHTPEGDLLITEANTEALPVFDYDDTKQMVGFVEMDLQFNGQAMHSHITVIRQASQDGGNAAEYTIRNPFVPVAAVFRPKTIVMSSGDDVTIKEFAENELRKELKAITLSITLDRGKLNGIFIRPNNTCRVKNRKIFLYKSVRWFIESVNFKVNSGQETSILTCVPTYVYSDEKPVNFFVDIHKNLPRI